jgi:hypothetical protein
VFAGPGFYTACSFLAASARSPAWPSAEQPEPGRSWGVQACGWPGDGAPAPPATPYFIISPFYGIPASEYATLLQHHMAYHAALGVKRYLVYVEAGATALTQEPMVQVRA